MNLNSANKSEIAMTLIGTNLNLDRRGIIISYYCGTALFNKVGSSRIRLCARHWPGQFRVPLRVLRSKWHRWFCKRNAVTFPQAQSEHFRRRRQQRFIKAMSDKTPTTAKTIDTEAQDDRPNAKRKLDQISTIEGSPVAANSENGTAKGVKRAPSETTRIPSIFGIKPVNDIVQYVSNFLWRYCDQENVEVRCNSLFVWSLAHSSYQIIHGAAYSTRLKLSLEP